VGKESSIDGVFLGEISASQPKSTLQSGQIARLINGRFIEGAITNAHSLDEIELSYYNNDRIYTSSVTHSNLLKLGDTQLSAPLCNISGKFIIIIVSGIIYRVDPDTGVAREIKLKDSFIPSTGGKLSYMDNTGGVYGVGGYLVIFNYPNRPIFINQNGARVSDSFNNEMPPMRLGATTGSRAFTVSADNILWASDILGGASSLAPLTYKQTLQGGTGYTGQVFTIGSALDVDYVTCAVRVPKFLGVAQDFLGQSLLVSTKNKKYFIATSTPRSDWESVQFITYGGSSDGISGPLAATTVGSNVVYQSNQGRYKSINQDQEVENSFSETFLDDTLGQYSCENETEFFYRDWYKNIDHSKSILKFVNNDLYCTAYPCLYPAIDRFGRDILSNSNKAMAVATLDSRAKLGPTTPLSWQGFRDDVNPVSIVDLDKDCYITSKNKYGVNSLYKINYSRPSASDTIIYTRGYLNSSQNDRTGETFNSKLINKVTLMFRRLNSYVDIDIYVQDGDVWKQLSSVKAKEKIVEIVPLNKIRVYGFSVPLKIKIKHRGCVFELSGIIVNGESYQG
jgi:hypothetical protein